VAFPLKTFHIVALLFTRMLRPSCWILGLLHRVPGAGLQNTLTGLVVAYAPIT